MRITVIYRGRPTDSPPLGQGLKDRETTHASATGYLHLLKELEALGHSVAIYSPQAPEQASSFPLTDSLDADLVLLWKQRGASTVEELGLDLSGSRVAAWCDARHLITETTPDLIMWGTKRIAARNASKWPRSRHAVVEHAANVPPIPVPMAATTEAGLYLGRLPAPYLAAVQEVARVSPVTAYALKVDKPQAGFWNLRPGMYSSRHMAAAQAYVGHRVRLCPAVNAAACAEALATFAFWVVAAASRRPQDLSASKAFDYWALGLPVLIDDAVPEAEHLSGGPWVGESFSIDRPETIVPALQRIKQRDSLSARAAILAWSKANHTYKQRAREIHGLIT